MHLQRSNSFNRKAFLRKSSKVFSKFLYQNSYTESFSLRSAIILFQVIKYKAINFVFCFSYNPQEWVPLRATLKEICPYNLFTTKIVSHFSTGYLHHCFHRVCTHGSFFQVCPWLYMFLRYLTFDFISSACLFNLSPLF